MRILSMKPLFSGGGGGGGSEATVRALEGSVAGSAAGSAAAARVDVARAGRRWTRRLLGCYSVVVASCCWVAAVMATPGDIGGGSETGEGGGRRGPG